jgi:hypothetical protein
MDHVPFGYPPHSRREGWLSRNFFGRPNFWPQLINGDIPLTRDRRYIPLFLLARRGATPIGGGLNGTGQRRSDNLKVEGDSGFLMRSSKWEFDGRAMLKGNFLDTVNPDHSARSFGGPSEVLERCGKNITLPLAPRENVVP